ncbi:MAG TPA: ABC transporter ATP-binding protein [Cyanobacteria bacterium UBA11369]|nr:ABC transporter ATP-binding protein [Cyanobacteria bacterium UBA11371]HBE20910.1 ABC transporter ATP-binding protein [Cyanobacteria bacterium UBA11367]HBE30089.1 ABC transporter ATP-binding protein [Cyanobacteria bacterium UBA11368]HBE48856.1 ABC transporter ATP-binding protein [Cyanobacteria bacterium UBA11369]
MKYPSVLQQNEEDCGAACLATIVKYYKKTFNINRIREAIGTGQLGTTLTGLRRGAENLGFDAISQRAKPEIFDKMKDAPLPAIIHWKGYHYVVLYGKRGRKYVIADPAVGIRYVTSQELAQNWTGLTTLLLQPDPARFAQQPDDKIQGISRFFQRVSPYSFILFEAFLINICVGVLSLTSPFLIQILTDDVLIRGDTQILRGLAIAIIIMNLVSSGLGVIQANLITQFTQRLELGFVKEFGRKILRLPLQYYETHRSGEVISRLQDIQQINQLVAQVVISLPSQFFIAIISFALMLFYSWKLSLFMILLTLLNAISPLIFLIPLRRKIRDIMVLDAENQGVLVESFKGAVTLKTTTAEPQFWEDLQTRFGRLANLGFRTAQIGITNSTFSGIISNIGGVALLWLGSTFVINKELTIGQLLAFNSMNGNFSGFIGAIIGLIDEFVRVKTAIERLTSVIDYRSEVQDDAKKEWVQLQADDNIYCEKLLFHHSGRLDLLNNFNVTIRGGIVTAIVGQSGCGKSTLVKLITGLYEQQGGAIKVGSYNLQNLSIECVRKQIILVPQDAHFWSRSIIDNFRLGSPHLTFEEIVKACQIAQADQFIDKLPEKYLTVLGEFGTNLSGGQRQRLAIARAIVNDPPVLILDESTAGLDPISEGNLLDKLLESRQGRTTILISHRPRVNRRANEIIYMEEGQFKLQGSLDDVLQSEGEHLKFLNG